MKTQEARGAAWQGRVGTGGGSLAGESGAAFRVKAKPKQGQKQ